MDTSLHEAIITLCETDDKELIVSNLLETSLTILYTYVPEKVSIVDLVRDMGTYLTHTDGHIRRRAVGILASVLEKAADTAPTGGTAYLLQPKETLRSLLSFVLDRLGDYPSVPSCLRTIKAILRIVEYTPSSFPVAAVVASKALFQELHVQASEQTVRRSVYDLLDYILTTNIHASAILGKAVEGTHGLGISLNNEPYALEFIVGLIQAIDGEKDPRCLLIALRCVEHALSTAEPIKFGEAITSLLEELFDVTACYFPITFTPPPNDPYGITREQLVMALRRVFASNPRLAIHVIPLLLDKLSSSLIDAKRDALQTLRMCASVYGAEGIRPFLMDICSALRKEIIYPRGNITEPGTQSNGTLLPSVWLGSNGIDKRRIGITVGSIGKNFNGLGPTHALSGYVVYTVDREKTVIVPSSSSSSSVITPPPLPAPVIEDALDTVAELTRILAIAAQQSSSGTVSSSSSSSSSSGGPQFWSDFIAMMVRSSVTEIERAAESTIGRASGRLLCAIASASPYAFNAVIDILFPILGEIHTDAYSHARHTVHAAALAVLGGLLHTMEPRLDMVVSTVSTVGHPLGRHSGNLVNLLLESIGTATTEETLTRVSDDEGTPNEDTEHNEANDSTNKEGKHDNNDNDVTNDTSTGTSGLARLPSGILRKTEARIAAVTEQRCIGIAALTDLCVRPPTLLLTPEQLTIIIERLVSLALEESDNLVQLAAVRGLCSLGSIRSSTSQFVQRIGLSRIFTTMNMDGKGSVPSLKTINQGFYILTQLASTSDPVLHHAIIQSLLTQTLSPLSVGNETNGNRQVIQTTGLRIQCIETIARIASLNGIIGNTACMDALATTFPMNPITVGSKKSETDNAVTNVGNTSVPVLSTLFDILFSFLQTTHDYTPVQISRLFAATELIGRMVSLYSTPEVQDNLRNDLTILLLVILEGNHRTFSTSSPSPSLSLLSSKLLQESNVSLFPFQQFTGTLQECVYYHLFCLLTKLIACRRKNSPVTSLNIVVRTLLTTALRLPGTLSTSFSSLTSTPGIIKSCHDPWLRATLSPEEGSMDGIGDETMVYTVGVFSSPTDENKNGVVPVLSSSSSSLHQLLSLLFQRTIILSAQTIGMILNVYPAVPMENKLVLETLSSHILQECKGVLQNSSSSSFARQTSIIHLVWCAKGLAMRGHTAANTMINTLLEYLIIPTNTGTDTDSHSVTLAATGLGYLLQDTTNGHPFSKEAGTVITGLYRQKIFGSVMNKYNELRTNRTSHSNTADVTNGTTETDFTKTNPTVNTSSSSSLNQNIPLMLSLCSMASYLPQAALLAETDRMLPIVVRSLEVVASKTTEPGYSSSSSSSVPRYSRDLQNAIAKSALLCLHTLLQYQTTTNTSIGSHIHSLVPVLLQLSSYQVPSGSTSSVGLLLSSSSSPFIRAAAIDCLRSFITLPYHLLHPLRGTVIKGLIIPLDDPKRAVRRRAAACRNEWLTLNA